MGPVTRLVQRGIGLHAELKAAKQERKASVSSGKDNKNNAGMSPELAGAYSIQGNLENQAETLQVSEGPHKDRIPEEDEYFMGGVGVVNLTNDSSTSLNDDTPPPYFPPPYTEEELADLGDVKDPRPLFSAAPSRLSCPIVIPQRRPGDKTRGFVRAYAPVLADYDMNEEFFLTFLKAFHKESLASPILNVITIGAGALGNIPEPFSLLAAISMSVMSGTAAELQGRYRTNNYLAKANEDLFKPRGLFCLVMSFRPNDVPKGEVSMAPVDTSNPALRWLNPSNSNLRMTTNQIRKSSGVTRGELEMPETAPLIYPDTGYAEISKPKSEDEGRSSFSSSRKVAAAYFDKRAQAKYAYKHPDSALTTETQPTFASKYGDPTHPTVTTGLHGRVSAAVKKESLTERQARKRAQALQPGSARGAIRRILPSSVLYLMIVNLPTEEELAEAREAAKMDS